MSKMLKVVGASWVQTKISSYILGCLGVLAILAVFFGEIERIQEDGNYAATVFYSDKTGYRIEYWGQSNNLADIQRGVARAYFRLDIDTTGWSLLEVETDGSYPDEVQAYAAGIVEGALTWYLIHTHLENTIRVKCQDRPLEKQCDKLRDALDKSVNIWKSYAAERGASDPFWHHVSLYYTQINGIFTGWKHGVERSMNEYETDISDLYWLNSIKEVIEIQHKLNVSIENSVLDILPDLSTAFVKITNETNEDGPYLKKLFVAHNTAGSYSSMTRILKRYKLNYHLTSNDTRFASGNEVDFSGYPGSVTSQDEFYIVKGEQHKMAVTGTALRNYNSKLWKDVNITERVPIGPRVTAANHLASNVSSWGHVLATSNSGTACKQWLVVDFTVFGRLNKTNSNETFTDKKEIITESSIKKDVKHTVVHRTSTGRAKGMIWLIEQVPGRTHSADLSDAIIEQGYWVTYGVPFFKDIAEITHYSKMEKKYGRIFSEAGNPRAFIFRHSHKNATNIEKITAIMRHNNMTVRISNNTKPCVNDIDCILKETDFWEMIGVRCDIVDKFKEPFGIIDTKIASAISGKVNNTEVDFIALSGPSYTSKLKANITTLVNKGNLGSLYTDQFDDVPTINGLEIRGLVKHQQEETEQKSLERLNKGIIKPFQWSESDFEIEAHEGLPDKWEFELFKPNWSW